MLNLGGEFLCRTGFSLLGRGDLSVLKRRIVLRLQGF
jgi:hypothetical protein